MQAAAANMYPATIMQQPIITITLIIIIPMLLNPYLNRVPARTAYLALPAPYYPLQARPEADVNYFAFGPAAERTLATF